MAREASAVLKGKLSKAVKAAEKLKALKAELKEALKEEMRLVKALEKAEAKTEKLRGKLDKLEGNEVPLDPQPSFNG